jgi:protein-tyrosine-phosphatase
MAAALLDHEAAGRIRVASAGSQPASQLNPAVVQAMAEIGLDISAEFPQPLTGDKVQAADVVITMGCGDACPVYPGKRYLDWDLPDPAGQPVETVRRIRDQIHGHVQALARELLPAGQPSTAPEKGEPMPGASEQTSQVKVLNVNWTAGPDGGDGRFEVMLVTADGQQRSFAPSPAAMPALLALAQAERDAGAILLWDPANRTLIAANIIGTWLAPTGLTRVAAPGPASE